MTSVRRLGCIAAGALAIAVFAAPARADEIWVAPTAQQDLGGLGIASNTVWPATAVGAVRLAWSIPDNYQYFKYAKLVLIPHVGGTGLVQLFVCPAESSAPVLANCTAPPGVAYAGPANRLLEVDISGFIGPSVGAAGTGYMAVLAYTIPNTATDHIVGLRFEYEPKTPTGVATTTGANTFSGTQTAPAFVGDGSGLTGLPFPAGAAALGANTFSGTQTAPAFVGSGAGLTGLPFPAGAATLGANTFSGTQTAPAFAGSGASLTGVAKLAANTFTGTQAVDAGNLDLDNSTATTGILTKNGARFLHNFGVSNTFLGEAAGNLTMAGGNNTAVGYASLSSNAGGSDNTAVGYASLDSNTDGVLNVAQGGFALSVNTTGWGNTAIGHGALRFSESSSRNVAVGMDAGAGFPGSHNIYLGANTSAAANEQGTIHLGSPQFQTRTFIAGIRGITTGIANAVPVVVDSNGQLGTVSSSIRFKEDIRDMADVSRRLLQLRPVTFRYTQAYRDGAKPIQFGLIAEEVADVFPELAVRGAGGQVETVHYETLNVLLLNELQRQAQRVADQDQRIDLLEQRHVEAQRQQGRIEALERVLGELLAARRD